jgi:hypothetical protein
MKRALLFQHLVIAGAVGLAEKTNTDDGLRDPEVRDGDFRQLRRKKRVEE